jgi:predicted Zn-dependent protease
VESIALHEIGHTLGLPHINAPLAVMSGGELDHMAELAGLSRRDLTPADLDALISKFGKSGS